MPGMLSPISLISEAGGADSGVDAALVWWRLNMPEFLDTFCFMFSARGRNSGLLAMHRRSP